MKNESLYENEDAARIPIDIQSERRSSIGLAQIARYTLRDPTDLLVPESDAYRLDMALVPRPSNARGHYSRHWKSDRYERLGSIWLVPPGEPVRFRSEPGTTTCVHCSLNPDNVAEWLGAGSGWGAAELDGTLDLRPGRIRGLMLHLADELRSPGFASEAMVALICGQISIEISRYWQLASSLEKPCGLRPRRLKAIDDRLAADDVAPTLAELANICGLSVRQLTRGFRLSRGHSIGEAIAARRIAQAKHLLLVGDSLKGVAHKLGFASVAGFAYAFRKGTGEAPGVFQKRVSH